MAPKLVSAAEAVARIADGSTVATGGPFQPSLIRHVIHEKSMINP